ncbi:MAG: muconolactone Delta-isomerase family protein, partial [Pseudomonadota bacterium]
MLYSLNFTVSYAADMTQADLFSVWKEEASAALGAKEAGVVVDLWKVVGERRVLAVVNVESPDLDVSAGGNVDVGKPKGGFNFGL